MEHRIAIGPDFDHPLCEFFTKDIYSLSSTNGVDVVGDELTIDQLISQVDYPWGENVVEVIAPSDYDRVISSDGYVIATNRVLTNPRLLPYGTIVRYFRDGILNTKMYVESVFRMANNIYRINMMSAVGLLDTQKHYGNIYRGATFENVVAEIIDGAVEYSMDDDVRYLQVYGWLPYDTKRANLHQLLFANGIMIAKDENGDIRFKFISNKESISIPKERIYQGGQVDYPAFASAVDVTEHSFFALPTDQVVTVYDNTDGSETADHTFIAFRDAPLHDLETTGTLVIEDSGVNWAIVTGTGILTGKQYTHSTRVMRLVAENASDQRENVVTLADGYLVNVTNSDNVARRLLAYYNSSKTAVITILDKGEKCGDLITGYDPYNEAISGFISSKRSIMSSMVVKSECEIITDYVPTGQGSNYTKAVVLTGNGTWEIPPEVFEKEHPLIQVTVISGGHGGHKGEDGEYKPSTFIGPNKETEGGEGGDPGPGGRVITVTIDCTGKTAFNYTCGEGGESEQSGTDTVFDEYSSGGGVPSPYGVANIFTGEVYGTTGAEKGVKGGRGTGDQFGPTVTYRGQSWSPGGPGKSISGSDKEGTRVSATGGRGGGAAVGANGGVGGDGDFYDEPDGTIFATGGQGGQGADGANGDDAIVLGGGGNGGHGGGGGGHGGPATGSTSNRTSYGSSGTPGKGGLGGKGGPGVILIYY